MSAIPEMKTIRDLSGFEKQLNRGYRRDMLALFILVALAGMIVMAFAHRYGPWVDAAAVENIVAARNLAWGNGLILPTAEGSAVPHSFQPPLYSLFLSVIFLLGLNPFFIVSVFNILLFGSILFLLSWGVWQVTQSLLLGLGAAILFSFTPALMHNFDGATSYGLLTFLVVANLICLMTYFQKENRRPYLLALLTAGLAFFTDFIGGACILTGALMLLIFSEKTSWRKLAYAGIYAFSAALPLVIWQVVQTLQKTQEQIRTLAISVSFGDAVSTYLKQVLNLFVQGLPGQPEWISTWLQTKEAFFSISVISLVLYGLLVWRYVENKDAIHRRWMLLLTICLLFIVSALGFIFAESYVQTRNAPEVSLMMLAPLYPFLIIFTFGTLMAIIASFDWPIYTLILPVLLGLVFIFANLRPTTDYIYLRYDSGSTYTTPQWQNSDLLLIVNQTSALRTYFTNDPQGVLLYTNWSPYDISHYDFSIPFLEQNDHLAEQFEHWSGTLLLIQPSFMNPETTDSPPIDFSTFTEGLTLVYRGTDGEMYVPKYVEESEN